MKIKTSEIVDAIVDNLKEYTIEVQDEIEAEEARIAKDAVKTLKKTSPKQSGKYGKGWKVTKDKDGTTVHNRVYQLTHLLEKGHAKVSGGRTKAIPHIEPVENVMIKEYEKAVEKAVKR